MILFSKLNTGFVLDSLGHSVEQILTGSFSPSQCFQIYFVNSFLTLNNISGRPHNFVPFGYLNIWSKLVQFKNPASAKLVQFMDHLISMCISLFFTTLNQTFGRLKIPSNISS